MNYTLGYIAQWCLFLLSPFYLQFFPPIMTAIMNFHMLSMRKEKKKAQFVLRNIQEATSIYFEKQWRHKNCIYVMDGDITKGKRVNLHFSRCSFMSFKSQVVGVVVIQKYQLEQTLGPTRSIHWKLSEAGLVPKQKKGRDENWATKTFNLFYSKIIESAYYRTKY